jgi:membrane fusion protein (multidrug efflux system)
LELILSDGSVYPRRGKWVFTDRQVDVNTGTLQVAAEFENPNWELRPGQYGLVRAKTEVRTNALLVPQRAVTELQGVFQLAIVDAQSKVHIKTVQPGAQIGREWLIDSGLEANDRVIVEGTQKIKEGTVVETEPFVAHPETAPSPAAPHPAKQG